jgi:hypothetical protein
MGWFPKGLPFQNWGNVGATLNMFKDSTWNMSLTGGFVSLMFPLEMFLTTYANSLNQRCYRYIRLYPLGCSVSAHGQEKQQLLQQWVETGENCDAIETQLKLIRSQEGEQERCRELLTIGEMRQRGFSQPLDI